MPQILDEAVEEAQMAIGSTLAGTLQRRTDGAWCWCDGTPEPRVRDCTRDWTYRFRSRRGFVEVPRQYAENEPDLYWVLETRNVRRYRLYDSGARLGPPLVGGNTSGRVTVLAGQDPVSDATVGRGTPIPQVILVPTAAWDAWTATSPINAEWAPEHEADILSRAHAFGWEGWTQERSERLR